VEWEKKSIAINCCLWSITPGGILMFVFVLEKNDREVLTSSPLYLNEGDYFSDGEFLAADGGFEGDGVLRSSYNIVGNDRNRQLFNLVFCEVRTFAENGYQRVGAWFPLLGNNKRKLPYTE
jgi:hypothetical protein